MQSLSVYTHTQKVLMHIQGKMKAGLCSRSVCMHPHMDQHTLACMHAPLPCAHCYRKEKPIRPPVANPDILSTYTRWPTLRDEDATEVRGVLCC